jgi:hypothetical protein
LIFLQGRKGRAVPVHLAAAFAEIIKILSYDDISTLV